MTPRIAIPVPTSSDFAYNDRSWTSYAAAVERSGGEPVRLELAADPEAALALAATCHGICLPGSPADVNPARFGHERHEATAPADLPRESTDFALLDHALVTGKPVLAICFGCQSLNVWRGGTLVQDLLPLPVNHSAGGKVAIAHTALVAPESLLGRLLTADADAAAEAPIDSDFLRLPVNTSHHQAVGSPGDGLRIVARCPDDGVVEAIEADPSDFSWAAGPALPEGLQPARFIVGVQWHPERSFDISPASRALFAALIAAARQSTAMPAPEPQPDPEALAETQPPATA